MRRLLIASLVAGLSLGLGGCAVVELAAHSVKAVERNQRDGGSRAESPQPAAAGPVVASEEPPPPQAAPSPRRSSVTVEELPAR